ncbi:hypothetical protein VOLCADRAFT_100225 [Volvox carteri f. nagariensis]|uniref:SRCR domain-containing protein n=1 Tax=Volvox carteri f. nagariensis TaxID=3068 RepID=D8UJR4_VOLCA|nr:uncharacterized protein VOLCADRAFT_100225 [Volvox carteri f. nagariensis]EFJ40037.1 hypothetical protein VOLCADRAFT_100225 [Volvox carteri f. nagariensis]|eukprot:XP_002958906.1 hypothetical protein VOLCADRAFT_100225 [Volvox carteri f. nagariensis]
MMGMHSYSSNNSVIARSSPPWPRPPPPRPPSPRPPSPRPPSPRPPSPRPPSPRLITNYGIRLVGGRIPSEGRVEVYNGVQWGTVCDDGFGDREASVVCRELGYRIGVALPTFGGGSGTILMDDVSCSASPTPARLYQCSFRGWGVNNCDHSEDVGVSCYGVYSLRLVGGNSPSEGRVEIYDGTQWGTVCDDYFTDVEASVVCRELGYLGGYAVSGWGGGSGPILLDNVVCTWTDTRLYQCNSNGWGIHNCVHSEVCTM